MKSLEQTFIKIPHCDPFVKWVGGKTQLLKTELDPMIPSRFSRYLEPFLGGGSMYLHMVSDLKLTFPACLSDINTDLITSYHIVKNNVTELIEILQTYEQGYKASDNKRQYFNDLRDDYNHQRRSQKGVDMVAMFITINKIDFNGMFRVNQNGDFNVPWRKYDQNIPTICDKQNLLNVSTVLNHSNPLIGCGDYTGMLLSEAVEDDFVYLDPPYYPISETSNFTSYSTNGFTKEDHIKLSKIFAKLSDRGCKVLLSNSNIEFIKELYSDFTIKEISTLRSINSKAERRSKEKNTELIISNWEIVRNETP